MPLVRAPGLEPDTPYLSGNFSGRRDPELERSIDLRGPTVQGFDPSL